MLAICTISDYTVTEGDFMNNIFECIRKYNNLTAEMEMIYHKAALKMGLTDSTSEILYVLSYNSGALALSDICRLSALTRQTVNSSIRKMEEEGLIYLDAIDGKSKKVCLTEKGKEYTKNTVDKIIKIENEICENWDDEEIVKYVELTEKFVKSLDEKVKKL